MELTNVYECRHNSLVARMSITVECAACRNSYAVDEKFVGRMVTCKKCGTLFRIEAPAPLPPPNVDPFENATFETPRKAKLPPSQNPKWRNPIETNAISDPVGEEDAPPIINQFSGRPRHAAFGFDAATPYILLLLVGTSIAFGVYWTIRINVATQAVGVAHSAIRTLWLTVAIFNFLFFGVVTPLMVLGVWAGTRLLKMTMVDSAYLRISGVAAPVTLFLAAYRLDGIPYPYALLLVLLLPAVFFMLKLMLQVDWAAGGVSFALGSIGFAIGFIILKFGCEMTVPPDAGPLQMVFYSPPAESRWSATASGSNSPQPALPPAGATAPGEAPQPPLPPVPTQQANVLPSVDPAVFALPMDGSAPDWTTVFRLSGAKLGPEVSFKKFKLRPPKEMRLDLLSSEDGPSGLVWKGAGNSSRFSIYTLPRSDPKQVRPVIADNTADERVTQKAGLLTINRTNVEVSYGQIDGVLFTRIQGRPDAPGDHSTQFIGPFDDVWLIVDFAVPAGDPNFAAVLGAAARSVRQIEPGEERSDPFAANLIAPRLAEDFEDVAALLRSRGKAAEDALVGLLQSKDGPTRMRALELLKDIATERSLPALRRAAKDPDPIAAGLAQEAVQRLQPAEASQTPGTAPAGAEKAPDAATILADLAVPDAARRKAAVAKLPSLIPEDKQRGVVIARLIAMLRAGDNAVPIADIVAALEVWGDATMVPGLMPLLDRNGNADGRHAAMRLLGNLKDGHGASVIAKWIALDPAPAGDALIAMGPAAEEAVIPILREPSAAVRIDAARILSQIGTRKCIPELQHASHDLRDAGTRSAAKSALESVKARAAAETPGK